jgi:tRNA (cmo5U34)-methyltransferase
MAEDFTFAHVQGGFDEHIKLSIRNYEQLLQDVVDFSRYFVEDHSNIVDIGCSTGKLTHMLNVSNQDHCTKGNYIGIEIAQGFQKDLEKHSQYKFIHADVRDYEFVNCSLITSLFTLQFMPKKDRLRVLKNIYNGLNTGGAFIFAEKILCENTVIQDMLTFNYYDFKSKNFSSEEIITKEKQLRNMLKPNTWKEIQMSISNAGFKKSERIWQNHMFVGAIAIK